MSDGPDNVDGVIEVVTETPPTNAPAEGGDTVVVVTEDGGDDPAPEVDRWVQITERVTNLENRVDEALSRAMQADSAAAVAQETAEEAGEHADVAADEAVEVAVEAVDGAEVVEGEDHLLKEDEPDTVEVDDSPGRRTHWHDRSFSDWRFGR